MKAVPEGYCKENILEGKIELPEHTQSLPAKVSVLRDKHSIIERRLSNYRDYITEQCKRLRDSATIPNVYALITP